jgi:hypothetical protein
MRESQLFIRNLLDFVALNGAANRAGWEEAHSDWDDSSQWQMAMFARWTSLEPLEIHPLVRAYIDEWIDTGFRPDGSEMPYERAFAPRMRRQGEDIRNYCRDTASEAPSAVRALAYVYHAELLPQDGDYSIHTREQPMSAIIGSKGGIVYYTDPIFIPVTPESLAAEIFLEFYRSEWLYRIMRCNRCKGIFLPNRKPRKQYERGWHCDKCRNSAAAQAATDARRTRDREQWFALAVGAYREYMSKPRRSTPDVSVFLTERVNKGLPYSSRIKRNTITHNLGKIQAAAEGRTENAEG